MNGIAKVVDIECAVCYADSSREIIIGVGKGDCTVLNEQIVVSGKLVIDYKVSVPTTQFPMVVICLQCFICADSAVLNLTCSCTEKEVSVGTEVNLSSRILEQSQRAVRGCVYIVFCQR